MEVLPTPYMLILATASRRQNRSAPITLQVKNDK